MGAPELSGPPGYSPTALDHIRAPRNVGRLAGANGFGEVDATEAEFQGPSELLKSRLEARKVKVQMLAIRDANHIETVMELGKPNTPLANAVLEMIAGAAR